MSFERSDDFKMSLSKTMEVLSINDDILEMNPDAYFEMRKFITLVKSSQDPDHAEVSYHVVRGQNVLSTFEKLKREVMDIHFASLSEKSMEKSPVTSYVCKAQGFQTEITFTTQYGPPMPVSITFTLLEQPKSSVFPNRPRARYIRMLISREILPSDKLKETFNQFMNCGGLLIDFITDTLWPLLIKLEMGKKKEDNNSEDICDNQKEVHLKGSNTFLPPVSRSFSGSDRISNFKSSNFKNDSRGTHQDGIKEFRGAHRDLSKDIRGDRSHAMRGERSDSHGNSSDRNYDTGVGSQDRRNDSRGAFQNRNNESHNKGPPIPRQNSHMSNMKGQKGHTRGEFKVDRPKENRNSTVGGPFGGHRKEVNNFRHHDGANPPPLLLQNCQQANRSNNGRGNGRRRDGTGHRSAGGSNTIGAENANWRKEKDDS